jgi:hypothetical protein
VIIGIYHHNQYFFPLIFSLSHSSLTILHV